MNFLNKFKKFFNITFSIQTRMVTKDSIWQQKESYWVTQSWIKGYIKRNNLRDDLITWNDVEFRESTHKLLTAPNMMILENDQIVDERTNEVYKVQFNIDRSWFDGEEIDHNIIYLKKLDGLN